MASAPALGTAPSGKVLAPPIYHLAGTAELQDGDHSHDVWSVRVVHADMPNYTLPMIVKALPSAVTVAVELACGLAAKELRLNVPQPGLVVADRDDLPGLADSYVGKRLLLVGSHFQQRDALFAAAVENSSAAEKMIWDSVCETPVGRQGAAWDELIANPDRHCENLLFDGTQWWLFDHDQALSPAAAFVSAQGEMQTRLDAITHSASVNCLAAELLQRYGGQHEAIAEQSRRLNSGTRRLQALANFARHWTHPDAEVQTLLKLIAIVLELIQLRLPALAEQLQRRIAPPSVARPNWP